MSTPYGEFKDRINGRVYYADASQIANRIDICFDNDTYVVLSVDFEQAKNMLTALSLAFEHNGWVFSDPLGGESSRNSLLIGALKAAISGEACWEETAKAALHNAGSYKE